jgi:hypothetical protein
MLGKRTRLSATAATVSGALIAGLLGLAVSGPPAAAADDTTGGDTYSVTFVARTCPQYTDV